MQNPKNLAKFLDELLRLEARYPTLVRRLQYTELFVDIEFYLEEMAMECAQAFLDAEITCIHRMDRPNIASIQLPSLIVQNLADKAIRVLDSFLSVRMYNNP